MSPFLFITNLVILLGVVGQACCGIYDYSHELGSSDHETLSGIDHLDESHFPADYYGHSSEHGQLLDIGYHHHELDDLTSKPVPGINHGKGVLSYSTTYEFPDNKH